MPDSQSSSTTNNHRGGAVNNVTNILALLALSSLATPMSQSRRPKRECLQAQRFANPPASARLPNQARNKPGHQADRQRNHQPYRMGIRRLCNQCLLQRLRGRSQPIPSHSSIASNRRARLAWHFGFTTNAGTHQEQHATWCSRTTPNGKRAECSPPTKMRSLAKKSN